MLEKHWKAFESPVSSEFKTLPFDPNKKGNSMSNFIGASEPLTKTGFKSVVDDLGIGIPELVAVLMVESKSCGFLPDRRPIILFERHIFHKLTAGRFSAANPDISNPVAGGYLGLEREYPRLEKAMKFDPAAALKSASWGAGQIMGFNHEAAGFNDVESMVASMQKSEDDQLAAVGQFLDANNLVGFLKAKNWSGFAKGYNGKDFAKNKYDVRLSSEFQKASSAGALPDLDVRRAQLYLTYLKIDPQGVDGVLGKFTRDAILRFRQANNLGNSDRVDKGLLEALQSAVRAG
jgi:hypothetical protein